MIPELDELETKVEELHSRLTGSKIRSDAKEAISGLAAFSGNPTLIQHLGGICEKYNRPVLEQIMGMFKTFSESVSSLDKHSQKYELENATYIAGNLDNPTLAEVLNQSSPAVQKYVADFSLECIKGAGGHRVGEFSPCSGHAPCTIHRETIEALCQTVKLYSLDDQEKLVGAISGAIGYKISSKSAAKAMGIPNTPELFKNSREEVKEIILEAASKTGDGKIVNAMADYGQWLEISDLRKLADVGIDKKNITLVEEMGKALMTLSNREEETIETKKNPSENIPATPKNNEVSPGGVPGSLAAAVIVLVGAVTLVGTLFYSGLRYLDESTNLDLSKLGMKQVSADAGYPKQDEMLLPPSLSQLLEEGKAQSYKSPPAAVTNIPEKNVLTTTPVTVSPTKDLENLVKTKFVYPIQIETFRGDTYVLDAGAGKIHLFKKQGEHLTRKYIPKTERSFFRYLDYLPEYGSFLKITANFLSELKVSHANGKCSTYDLDLSFDGHISSCDESLFQGPLREMALKAVKRKFLYKSKFNLSGFPVEFSHIFPLPQFNATSAGDCRGVPIIAFNDQWKEIIFGYTCHTFDLDWRGKCSSSYVGEEINSWLVEPRTILSRSWWEVRQEIGIEDEELSKEKEGTFFDMTSLHSVCDFSLNYSIKIDNILGTLREDTLEGYRVIPYQETNLALDPQGKVVHPLSVASEGNKIYIIQNGERLVRVIEITTPWIIWKND